ncbi:MAG: hypothetical protein ABIF10_06310, partial [Candidatus Woesearchaeota archaeon]
KIRSANLALIFGSVLIKQSKAGDVDVLFVTDQQRFENLKKEINMLNNILPKRLHPIFQSPEDFRNNLAKLDKVVCAALRGIVAFGEDKLVSLVK